MDKVLFRAIGDGKTIESQIVLGLLVSEGGYPLSYSIFNGSQYEGRTMIPIIDDFIQRFSIKEFVVVADSGLIVSYSDKRAAKDASNRIRGVARLQKSYQSGVLRKDQVNKRGYNKFLHIDNPN